MAEAIVCDKNELIDIYPCFQCLNKSELMAVLVYVLASLNGKDVSTDLPTMMEDAACIGCLDDKKMLEAIVGILASAVVSRDTTMDEIRADVACLLCVDPKMIKAMIVKELCTYWTGLPA